MNPGQERQVRIIAELDPLFAKAEAGGKWFYSSYGEVWFSPAELREQQGWGKFIWGAKDWRLRNPLERLVQLERIEIEAHEKSEAFASRLTAAGVSFESEIFGGLEPENPSAHVSANTVAGGGES